MIESRKRIGGVPSKGAVAAAFLTLSLAIASPSASAQLTNSESDIEVKADNANFDRNTCQGVWKNNVVAVQGETRLLTESLTMVMDPPDGASRNCGAIRKFIAEGKVYYVTPDERISADRAEYDYESDTITMTGTNVVMTRGEDGVMRGTRLVFAVGEGQATVTSDTGPVTSYFPSRKHEDDTTP